MLYNNHQLHAKRGYVSICLNKPFLVAASCHSIAQNNGGGYAILGLHGIMIYTA